MVKIGVIGLVKMGLSHLSIVRTHPDVKVVGVCDATGYVLDVMAKYTGLAPFGDYRELLDGAKPDAVLIATPSRSHGEIARAALERGVHVFVEKPFCLSLEEAHELVALARRTQAVNQVGYHYRFVGAFKEAARVVSSGALGTVHHVRAEAFGPVVLRRKGATWRSAKSEGGGALYDYACHAIDLVNFVVGAPTEVGGVVRASVFSRDVDDEVYATLRFEGGASGQLSVNWSDESFRKMSTRISVWGTNGRITADRQECQLYLRERHDGLPGIDKGWTVRYTTDLSDPVWFYLRGEEYSAQIDYFANSVASTRLDGENSFESAIATDRVVAMLLGEAPSLPPSGSSAPPRKGLWARLAG